MSNCGDNYYPDTSDYKCKSCYTGCKTCTTSSSNSCSSCIVGKILQDNTCVDNCSPGYY